MLIFGKGAKILLCKMSYNVESPCNVITGEGGCSLTNECACNGGAADIISAEVSDDETEGSWERCVVVADGGVFDRTRLDPLAPSALVPIN